MDTTLLKGLRVLEALALSNTPQSIGALSQQLDLQKSNVHRTLATLIEAGFVYKDDATSRYGATLRLWEMGSHVIARNLLRRAALPFMRALHQETQETIYLAILNGTDVMYLEKIDAVFPLVQSSQPAQRTPAIWPASGLALLAFHPDAHELIEEIAAIERDRHVDIRKVLRTIKEIQTNGFAITTDGWNVGARSVAAPIFGANKAPIGAVGIAGPRERLEDETLERYVVLVRNAATRIAEVVGQGSLS